MTDTRDRVDHAISQALADCDEMVTKWVSLIETVDSDGVRALWLLTSGGAKAWDNMGMLSYALACEQGRITTDQIREDD